MARLVIGKNPDHRWLSRRPSALIRASIRLPEYRGTLKVELPAQSRIAPARRFEMLEPPFARAACHRQPRPVREACRCRVERYGCGHEGTRVAEELIDNPRHVFVREVLEKSPAEHTVGTSCT